MMSLIVILTLAIGLLEGIPLLKHGQRKELIGMSTILGIALLLTAANYLGYSSPLVLLELLLEPIGKAIFK